LQGGASKVANFHKDIAFKVKGEARMQPPISFPKVAWVFIAVLFISNTFLAAAALSAESQSDLSAILRQMEQKWQQPLPMGFSQAVDAKGWLGKYHFTSTVVRDEKGTHVSVTGAPVFISSDFLADLADFKKAMAGFDLKYNGKVTLDNKEYYLLSGARRKDIYSGALEGSIWVDAKTYLVYRLQARYSWGKVDVLHTYAQKSGYTVLLTQEATVSPISMRMTVVYSDYWFGKR
jgi:hypothetical protein